MKPTVQSVRRGPKKATAHRWARHCARFSCGHVVGFHSICDVKSTIFVEERKVGVWVALPSIVRGEIVQKSPVNVCGAAGILFSADDGDYLARKE